MRFSSLCCIAVWRLSWSLLDTRMKREPERWQWISTSSGPGLIFVFNEPDRYFPLCLERVRSHRLKRIGRELPPLLADHLGNRRRPAPWWQTLQPITAIEQVPGIGRSE